MKKFLAVIMSLVMLFSLAALPVAAAEEEAEVEVEETVTLDEVFDTLVLTVELIEDTIYQIHSIVGSILGMLAKECPMCGEVHQVVAEEESPEEELPEDFEELPEEELPEDIESLLAA